MSESSSKVTVFVEIPSGSNLKYEMDVETNRLLLDRVLSSSMGYPGNYGYIPDTLAQDGDPLDALIIVPYGLHPGCYVECRVLGALVMSDEKGVDEKLLVVPVSEVDSYYDEMQDLADIPKAQLDKIEHFFRHYKDTDPKKWCKVEHFINREEAIKLVETYQSSAQ